MIANAAAIVAPGKRDTVMHSQLKMTWSCLQADNMQVADCLVVLTGQGVVIDSLSAASLATFRLVHDALLVPFLGLIKPLESPVTRLQPNWSS